MRSASVLQISKALLGLIGNQRLEGIVGQYGMVDHTNLGIQGGINMIDNSETRGDLPSSASSSCNLNRQVRSTSCNKITSSLIDLLSA